MNDIPWRARWSTEQVRSLLVEQFEAFWRRDTGVERHQLALLERARSAPHAVVISGMRRAGKSTLLAQLAHRLGEEAFHYVNFEDERFIGFGAEDANDLWTELVAIFGERHVVILDEVQNIPAWERFVRRFMEMGVKFYLTGSNAALLSGELGSRLTGRYLPVELFPFSFDEYLRFRDIAPEETVGRSTTESAMLQGRLAEYLRLGGIPESLKYPDLPLSRALYDDVIHRDIAARHRIVDLRALRELAYFLMSHPACLVSYNKLKEQLGLGSVNTVKSYIGYLEGAWLLLTANRHDFSVKRQQIAPKKVYPIDTGLAQAVGFSFSPNSGHLLETAVYLALRRRSREVYYFRSKDGLEVDFYLPAERQLIQVTQSLAQPATRERELRALEAAMSELGLAHGLILTDVAADPVDLPGGRVELRSAARWLLEG